MNATQNTTEVDYNEDLFCWTIEGVCILIIGIIGLFGNSCSMVLFSRQKVHRIFHHLLLLLTCFDMVRINIHISLKTFLTKGMVGLDLR